MNNKRITFPTGEKNREPVIRDTHIPVREVLRHLAAGLSFEKTLQALPGLELDDIQAVLEYSAALYSRGGLSPQQNDSPVPPASFSQCIEPKAAMGNLDPKKVLVVDDVDANRLLIKSILKNSNFDLIMAVDGEEGLAKAREERPFLIISDIQMPRLTGLEFLSRLKSDPVLKYAGVIFVTAHRRDTQQVSHGLGLGADDYITMPFKREEFLARVGAVVRVKWAEAEARRQAQVVAQRNKGLELVNELALAVNSSLDLQEIFASALQKLSQLLEADAVSLLLFNEETKEWVIDVSAATGEGISTTAAAGVARLSPAVIQAAIPAVITDTLAEFHTHLNINQPPTPDAVHCVPMVSKAQAVGAIAIINKHGPNFEESEQVLLNSAAGIIAVALENAHLLQQAQTQVDDLIVLNEIGRALTSTLNLEQILQQTARLLRQSLQVEAASVWLLDEESRELALTASSGVGADGIAGFRLPVEKGISGYVVRSGDSYIADDLLEEQQHFRGVGDQINYRPRSMLCVPLRVKDKIIGVMVGLHSSPGWFNSDHQRLFSSAGSSVGIAIENARLFNEVQDFSLHLEQMVAARTKELAEEKEKTDAILAGMADGLLVLDGDKRVLTANAVAEAMLNIRSVDLTTQSIHPRQMEGALWTCIDRLADGIESNPSAPVDVPDPQTETTLSIQAHAAGVRDEDEQVIGTVIVLRDITAITEVERMKAQFMAGVTHELKTPLSVIKLHAKNLLAYHHRLPEQKREQLLNAIQKQVQSLEKLIENILELSRLDAGVIHFDYQEVDLNGLILRIVDEFQFLAQEKQVDLHWFPPQTPLLISGDPPQIERVLRNLVDNALKYTSSGGSVEVRCEAARQNDQNIVQIQVSDTGQGIAPAGQAKIFDRFYRVDASHTIPGTGLGLSIVKEIVEAHGGTIHLESVPGAGSTFTVTLPGEITETDQHLT